MLIYFTKVKVFSRVLLFVAPWTVAPLAPLSMGFSRQEHWHGLPFPSPGDLPDPGIEPASLSSPALAAYCWHLLASPPSFIFQIQIIMTFHSLLPSLLHPNLPLVC